MFRGIWKRPLQRTSAALLLALGLAATLPPINLVRAHHGWSGYDSGNGQTLEGTIVEATYENPHGMILAPPSRMQNRGLSADMLRPGAEATVIGYPSKTVEDELRAERITVGGATTELR